MDPNRPVLLVGDDLVLLQLLGNMLRNMGLTNVHAARGAEEGLAAMRATPPALVIAEWDMHAVDGIGLLRQVRRDSVLAATPYALITSRRSFDSIEDVRNLGATTVLVKPIPPPKLRALIDPLT